MTEPVPIPAAPLEFPGGRAALRLGAVLLAGLAVALAMVARDEARRGSLETVVESTGVGDTHYVPEPEKAGPANRALVALHGEPLFPASRKRHEKRDIDMRRVARDEATGLNIYTEVRKPKAGVVDPPQPAYFLKLAPGEYLQTRRAEKASR